MLYIYRLWILNLGSTSVLSSQKYEKYITFINEVVENLTSFGKIARVSCVIGVTLLHMNRRAYFFGISHIKHILENLE